MTLDEPVMSLDEPKRSLDEQKRSLDKLRMSLDEPKRSLEAQKRSLDERKRSFFDPRRSLAEPMSRLERSRLRWNDPGTRSDECGASGGRPRTGRNGRERLESGIWTAENTESTERGGDNQRGAEARRRAGLGLAGKGVEVWRSREMVRQGSTLRGWCRFSRCCLLRR